MKISIIANIFTSAKYSLIVSFQSAFSYLQDIENGRKLLVFYPFAEPESGTGKCFSLTIYAQCEICISNLVGLCCYEYARCQRTNNIEYAFRLLLINMKSIRFIGYILSEFIKS